MNKLINDLFFVLLGAVLGVLLKYLYDYKGMVHKELWTKRYETYKTLFSLTGILPQYPHKAEVTYEDLFKRSEAMRDWFFTEGGLLLSTKTRNKYFKVQRHIEFIIGDKGKEARLQNIGEDYEEARVIFSQLRRQMADDLMSRSRL